MSPAAEATTVTAPEGFALDAATHIPILHPPQGRIIRSLLDADWYKFTMMFFIWTFFRKVTVTFGLANRSGWEELGRIIDLDQLRAELDHVRTLSFQEDEIEFLGLWGGFSKAFLSALRTFQLPEYKLGVTEHGQLDLTFTGTWWIVTLWETIALAIVNELYYRAKLADATELERMEIFSQGIANLQQNIEKVAHYPEIKFTEFGTRRRFSALWQELVVRLLAKNLPDQLMGTSNAYLAKKYNLKPIGTMAHELFMVAAALGKTDKEIRASHNDILRKWYKLYGKKLSIALTDTFGSKFFFEDMTKEQAEEWMGLRQDSGDPFEFGENAIDFYEKHGINPHTKLLVFSDGLDSGKIVQLFERFAKRIQVSFGWGTHLTNNLGFRPLSLVIKAIVANGKGTVKISDNLNKAMGAIFDIKRYKDIFEHTSKFKEELVV